MRRVLPIVLAIAALAGPALAQDKPPAIAPASPSTPPIEPGAKITPADLEAINAQLRTDEEKLTVKRDAEEQRENGVIANTRVALNFNPYPHGRIPNLARLIGWRKPKQ
jgi:hypothetical protein